MTDNEFLAHLSTARAAGEATDIVYLENGCLATARERRVRSRSTGIPGDRTAEAQQVHVLAKRVWAAYLGGLGYPVQRKKEFGCDYIFRVPA